MKRQYDNQRSYIEVDLDALRHNVKELMTLLDDKNQLMAVVKADAYGHGAIEISRQLNELGVNTFAVATLAEAIELRENQIKGDILILGYTCSKQCTLLKQYHLTQTLVSYEYALELNQQKIPVDVHIAVDTGMHRLGSVDISNIRQMYKMEYLHVTGIFSHLCVCDSSHREDVEYTKHQIDIFKNMISQLEKEGYSLGKIHLQSSYGLLNYTHLNFDYVRIGISLYGVYSSLYDKHHNQITLKPILSLKSQVALIKDVKKGETIGYGRTYKATKYTKIAVIPIGYADGIPRILSNRGYVLVKGHKAPIVGRICMDQMMVDISHIHDVCVHDTVTIIGQDGDACIYVEDIAHLSKTISNEILSRLGQRLPRIYNK